MLHQIEFSSPEQSGLSKGQINAIAEQFAEQLSYSPGDALEPIIEAFGGRIEVQSLWDLEASSSGSIQIFGEGDFVIYIAEHTGPLRDRFTIAHELGHYIVHYLIPKSRGTQIGPMQAQRYGSGRVEWEANWFAAGFLMPAEVFKKSVREFGSDLAEVASRFGVSLQAAEIRAQSLGLTAAA